MGQVLVSERCWTSAFGFARLPIRADSAVATAGCRDALTGGALHIASGYAHAKTLWVAGLVAVLVCSAGVSAIAGARLVRFRVVGAGGRRRACSCGWSAGIVLVALRAVITAYASTSWSAYVKGLADHWGAHAIATVVTVLTLYALNLLARADAIYR